MTSVSPSAPSRSLLRRILRRDPLENAATAVIAAGVVMLCQPFWLTLYTYSFVTILGGTVMFVVVSKFPR
jgi:hypothetical protein